MNMDFISFILGMITGVLIFNKIIKMIAAKNKQKFMEKVVLATVESLNNKIENEMVLDAISGEVDQLIKYHGTKIKVENCPYYMCWIDGKSYMLPSRCLTFINDSEKSESSL